MSGYRDLVAHRRGLTDIRAILAGLRTLAVIETQRLTRLRDGSQRLRAGMQRTIACFRAHYPAPEQPAGASIRVVIGSEKGLCGDFNEALVRYLRAQPIPAALVLVGDKLRVSARDLPQIAACCPGALAADDVALVLAGLVAVLARLGAARGGGLDVISHDPDAREVRILPLLPLPAAPGSTDPAPLLYLSPPVFEAALTEQYLFAMLTGALQDALLAENQQRVTHLEGAVQRLDEQSEVLGRQLQRARQSQIIEEIEVALAIPSASAKGGAL